MSKTLRLTIHKKWFDMILSGEKKEEYREIKGYWVKRFAPGMNGWFNLFDFIEFKNGYRKDAAHFTIKCEGIAVGRGKTEWGAPADKDVFTIKLGEII